MRKMIALAAMALLTAACSTNSSMVTQASGERGQRSFDVAPFEAIDSAGPHNVIVTVGGAPAVRAEGDTALLERLDVRVENRRLRIRMESGWTFSRAEPLTIHVTAPTLTGAALSGSGDMNVAPFQAARFRGTVAGSGNLMLGGVQADAADFSVAGSGSVRALGTARQASLSIAGSGDADLAGFQSDEADISIAGSGDARLLATRSASVSIMGSGNVAVTGGARCRVRKVGSGEVVCG